MAETAELSRVVCTTLFYHPRTPVVLIDHRSFVCTLLSPLHLALSFVRSRVKFTVPSAFCDFASRLTTPRTSALEQYRKLSSPARRVEKFRKARVGRFSKSESEEEKKFPTRLPFPLTPHPPSAASTDSGKQALTLSENYNHTLPTTKPMSANGSTGLESKLGTFSRSPLSAHVERES